MQRIELIGEKTTEFYENRDDRVVYRSIRFEPIQRKVDSKDLTHNDRYMG